VFVIVVDAVDASTIAVKFKVTEAAEAKVGMLQTKPVPFGDV